MVETQQSIPKDPVSLFEQLGGDAGVAIVVTDFYGRISSDDLLAPWFTDVDRARIEFHLRAYLAVALGGPEAYSGRSMRQVHRGLKITDEAFDTVLKRFADSLLAAGAEHPLVAKVVKVIATLRPVVVQVSRG
jgi:hemoglobin